jgi:hypothetical protein
MSQDYILQGFVKFGLKINGIQVPIGPSTIRNFSIIESQTQKAPVFHGTILDQDDLHSQGHFKEGDDFSVTMHPEPFPQPEMNFKIFNILSKEPHNGLFWITFTGMADQAPAMVKQLATKPQKDMTSSDAIAAYAKELGIQAKTDPTNDKMDWMPMNHSVSQFMNRIADHGYGSSKSIMKLFGSFDSNNQLQVNYRDLSKIIAGSHVKTLATPNVNESYDIMIDPFIEPKDLGGTANYHAGFKSSVSQPDLKGKFPEFKDVDVPKMVKNLNISNVNDLVKQVRRQFMPMDAGNTHDNYAKSLNQNTRGQATFSKTCHVMTMLVSGVTVMDKVKLLYSNKPDGTLDPVISGDYIVGTKTRFVTGNFYREKLVLYTQGSNV